MPNKAIVRSLPHVETKWKSSGNHVDMDVSHSDSYLLYLDYKQRVFHIYADIFARGCVERVDLNNQKMHDLE